MRYRRWILLEYISMLLPRGVVKVVLRSAYKYIMKYRWVRHIAWGETSIDKCHNYWMNPPDRLNKPSAYLQDGTENSTLVLAFIRKYTDENARILEIGCNAGRNLRVLYEAGYRNLCGVEINSDALRVLRNEFPEMASNIVLHNKPVEDVIRDFPDSEFDVVFTMATLEHVHEDSNWIFREMARVTRKVLITLEDELAVSWRTFPRDYKNVFEGVGMKQIDYDDCSSLPEWHGSYKLRVFLR